MHFFPSVPNLAMVYNVDWRNVWKLEMMVVLLLNPRNVYYLKKRLFIEGVTWTNAQVKQFKY